MTVREYLHQVQVLEEKVEDQQDYIKKLEDSLTSFSLDYSKDSVQTSAEDSMGKVVSKILDAEKKLQDLKEKACLYRCQVIEQIYSMENKSLKQILMFKYIDWRENKTWNDVAAKMNYSYKYVLELHEQALFQFRLNFLP